MDTTDGFDKDCLPNLPHQDEDVTKQSDNIDEQSGVATTIQKQVDDGIDLQNSSRNEEQATARNGRPTARNERGQRSISAFRCQKGKTYKLHKDLNFLTLMQDILPIVADEWSHVVEGNNNSEPPQGECEYDQNTESIQKRQRNLYLKHAPIGDPNCPENIRLAKKVKVMISQKLDA